MKTKTIQARDRAEGELEHAAQDSERRRLAEIRAMLMRDFGIDSVFVGVPKLARILGMSPSTIYGYMRQRSFFIPYRLLNKTPVVRLDDLAQWYCSPDPDKSSPLALERREPDCSPQFRPPGDVDLDEIDSPEMRMPARSSRGRASPRI